MADLDYALDVLDAKEVESVKSEIENAKKRLAERRILKHQIREYKD